MFWIMCVWILFQYHPLEFFQLQSELCQHFCFVRCCTRTTIGYSRRPPGRFGGPRGPRKGYQCWVVSLGLDLCKDDVVRGSGPAWWVARMVCVYVYCAVTSHVLHFYKQQTNNSRASDMSSHNLGRSNSDLSSTTASLQPKKPSVAPNRYC